MGLACFKQFFPRQERHKYYEHKLDQLDIELQTQTRDSHQRAQTLAALSQLVLRYQTKLLPQEKVKTLKCLSLSRTSDPRVSNVVIPLLFENETCQQWDIRHCIKAIFFLGRIPNNHLTQVDVGHIILSVLRQLTFLIESNNPPTVKDCVSALQGVREVASFGQPLQGKVIVPLKRYVLSLLSRIEDKEIKEETLSHLLAIWRQLPPDHPLQDLPATTLNSLRENACSLLSCLWGKNFDGFNGSNTTQRSLTGIERNIYIDPQDLLHAARRFLEEWNCAVEEWSQEETQGWTQKCTDVVEQLSNCTQFPETLTEEEKSSLQDDICALTYVIAHKHPTAEQCAKVLCGLGCFALDNLLAGISEDNQHSLQKSILFLFSNLKEGEIHNAWATLWSIKNLMLHGSLGELAEEERSSMQGTICYLVHKIMKEKPDAPKCSLGIGMLSCFSESGLLKNLAGEELSLFQRGVGELSAAVTRGITHPMWCSNTLSSLGKLSASDLLKGLSKETRRVLQGSVRDLIATLRDRSPNVDESLEALLGLVSLTKHAVLEDLPEENKFSLQEGICALMLVLGREHPDVQQCSLLLSKFRSVGQI